MFIQKDIYPSILAEYKKFNAKTTEINYSNNYKIQPMKYTENLILNQEMKPIKNAPIQNSDKTNPHIIKPYHFFKGAKALPTFKQDLKSWSVCC